jgi:hypothetical protein
VGPAGVGRKIAIEIAIRYGRRSEIAEQYETQNR